MSLHLIDAYKEKYVKVKENIKALDKAKKQVEFELDLYENVSKDIITMEVDVAKLQKERVDLHAALSDQRYFLIKLERYIKALEEKASAV
jgi:hypothetical protein